eukprot:TRINITY_DN28892_c0_g1_i1.p1 TRINITY_DN28892_c0_g1~~TRINITY_DN28892_c0_g1_i1.p1  ORF type:complete len:123 (+),score=17.21 TRINITY_DN28892_c0_g1_i1:328-696(+)
MPLGAPDDLASAILLTTLSEGLPVQPFHRGVTAILEHYCKMNTPAYTTTVKQLPNVIAMLETWREAVFALPPGSLGVSVDESNEPNGGSFATAVHLHLPDGAEHVIGFSNQAANLDGAWTTF